MAAPYLAIGEPLEVPSNARCSKKALALVFLLMGLGCVVLLRQTRSGQVQQAAINAYGLPVRMQLRQAEGRAISAAAANINSAPLSSRYQLASIYTGGVGFAARDGIRAGCRGQLVCMRAVGLFFGTQSGKTEEVANAIAEKTGLEAKDVGDIGAEELTGYDGLIVGVPTWHTGADEQRSGTMWDDYLDKIRALNLKGKPVAIFGSGDSVSYGDNYCDAIEELHSTFSAAGAKMLGYVSADGYQHADSKSLQGDKFLGLATDQDNEDDLTEGRVAAWVDQIKKEGMPLP